MREENEQSPTSLETLTQRLEAVKKLQPEVSPNTKLPGDAARSAIDFASASAVGTLLGYGLDVWLNTLPWGLIGGLFIGTAAGLKLMFQNEARERAKAETDKNETK